MRLRLGLLASALLLIVVIAPALTASNPVPQTYLGRSTSSITANTLKPASCAGITLSTVALGSGDNNANLVLGTATGQTIRGRNGDDCILGGAGNDTLRGDQGTDVCIGGPGTDTFNATCETQIQ
jgi:Ca2+-binding RTX toxin-like protein